MFSETSPSVSESASKRPTPARRRVRRRARRTSRGGYRSPVQPWPIGVSGKQTMTLCPDNPQDLPVVWLITDSNGRNAVCPRVARLPDSAPFVLAITALPGGTVRHGITEFTSGSGHPRAPLHEIILALGTNDVKSAASAQRIPTDVAALVAAVKREHPGSRLSYLSVLPRADELAHHVGHVNEALRQMSAAHGFSFVDLAGSCLDIRNETQWSDNIHLSDQGLQTLLTSIQLLVQSHLD